MLKHTFVLIFRGKYLENFLKMSTRVEPVRWTETGLRSEYLFADVLHRTLSFNSLKQGTFFMPDKSGKKAVSKKVLFRRTPCSRVAECVP